MINTEEKVSTPFQLKGGLFTITVLQLQHCEIDSFKKQLEKVISQAPKFFQFAPMVIDLNEFDFAAHEFRINEILEAMRQENLIPFGVRGGNEAAQEQARQAGLAIVHNSNQAPETQKEKPQTLAKKKLAETKSEPESDKQNYVPTRIITQPIRSGQQIYAKNSDLIILSSVSHGAEILADGNIHVYGSMRGRALAGIMGNTEAKIFCKSMDAELVSIAGRYLVNEQLEAFKDLEDVHVYLDQEHLKIEKL